MNATKYAQIKGIAVRAVDAYDRNDVALARSIASDFRDACPLHTRFSSTGKPVQQWASPSGLPGHQNSWSAILQWAGR